MTSTKKVTRPQMSITLDKINELTTHYVGEILKANAIIEDINAKVKAQRKTDLVAHEEITDLENQKAHLISKAKEQIDGLKADYLAKERAFQKFNGDHITDDMKLLSGSFPLSRDDVIALAAKHGDNYTMYQSVLKYAQANGIPVKPIQSVNSLSNVLDKYIGLITPRIVDAGQNSVLDRTISAMGEYYKSRALAEVWGNDTGSASYTAV